MTHFLALKLSYILQIPYIFLFAILFLGGGGQFLQIAISFLITVQTIFIDLYQKILDIDVFGNFLVLSLHGRIYNQSYNACILLFMMLASCIPKPTRFSHYLHYIILNS
ncbi:hypothetical protein ACJX0J_012848, partial [Zea mays]